MILYDQFIFNGLVPLSPGLKVFVCLERIFRSPSRLNLAVSLNFIEVSITGWPAKSLASCSSWPMISRTVESPYSNNWRVFFSWSQAPPNSSPSCSTM